jgi:hypothetical protein
MVWTVCVLYFQSILLVSYGYVYLINRFSNYKTQKLIHLLMLAGSFFYVFPILWGALPGHIEGTPTYYLLYLLSIKLTWPLLVLSATSPLLQSWFSKSTDRKARDPYFLYATSNLGSMLALLSYPLAIEKYMGLIRQSELWSSLYFIFGCLLVLLAILLKQTSTVTIQRVATKITVGQISNWLFLSFVPVSLMLAVTTFISTDIASFPFVWVLPLSLYLLSFILTFSNTPLISQAFIKRNIIFVVIFVLMGLIVGSHEQAIVELLIFNLAFMFMGSLLCHGELYALRPPVNNLTVFYLCLAIGGVLAGAFNSIIAPLIFNQLYEYPLAILLTMAVLIKRSEKLQWLPLSCVAGLLFLHLLLPDGWLKYKYYPLLPILCLILITLNTKNMKTLCSGLTIMLIFVFVDPKQDIIWQDRNFYGAKQVLQKGKLRYLKSQTTVHGAQLMSQDQIFNSQLTYYHPVASIINYFDSKRKETAIIGLGIGSIGCQFTAKDHVLYIEIDPQVIKLAKDPSQFTMLRDCNADIEIKLGDGRLGLANQADNQFDMIIIDAFTSDAIPTHLLTQEAIAIYIQKLKSDGLLLFHLSNRHIDLLPILQSVSQKHSLYLYEKQFKGKHKFQMDANWAIITSNELVKKALLKDNWQNKNSISDIVWTDDYSNILPLLKF